MKTLTDWLERLGLGASEAHAVAVLGALGGMVLLSVLANFVAKRWLLAFIRKGASRTRTQWDDILVRMRVFHRLAHLAPALVIYLLTPVKVQNWDKTITTIPTYALISESFKNWRGMTFLVRQLAPTSHGLPIEIYVFSKDQRWVNYEGIQSDIFDHILAVVPEFDLRVFQEPSGNDLRLLTRGVFL